MATWWVGYVRTLKTQIPNNKKRILWLVALLVAFGIGFAIGGRPVGRRRSFAWSLSAWPPSNQPSAPYARRPSAHLISTEISHASKHRRADS